MKQIIIRYALPAIALCFAGAGCNPKLYAPEVDVPESYIYAIGKERDSLQLSEQWWQMFGDTTLNRLIERALSANRNLAAAVSRIEEARDNLRVVRAEFLPSVDVGVSAGATDSEPTSIQQSYKITPTISWEVPLFGSLRHTSNAAHAEIAYAEWQYSGVRLSLAAEVATTYFTLLQYKRDYDIAVRSSQLRRESASLIDSIFRRGMATGLNLERAKNLVYTAEADIPVYDRAIRQTLLSLDVLLGEMPDSTNYATTGLRLITDYKPLEIPAGLPSDILHRRPDVMSAYWQMEQAAANVGIARSARFPSISLTAAGGASSIKIGELFNNDSWYWSVLGSLAQPLFRFGSLKRSEMAARERYRQAVLAYEQTYIEAVSDVESALVSIAAYREETARYRQLVQSNTRVAIMTSALYNNGLSAYLDVIDAERTLYDSQMQFSNIVAQQYINYVNLCKALGGGWVEIPTNR